MTMEPKVIAFDFYDGATEGFAESLLDGSDCYFALVAWDSDQDDRLYAAVKIERPLYARVKFLLGKTQAIPSLSVWLPRWEFAEAGDEREVSELTRSCRHRIGHDGHLLLTRHIGEQPTGMLTIHDELAPKVNGVLERGTPDDLALWREHFGD
ncbi:MAG: hypothetical protein ACREP7_14290 [Lysobacter sp.]